MKLIIAEKPSLGRSIADAIPGSASGRDPIYKGEYCITWLYGHILGLKEPQDYDEAYGKWSVEQLPIYFDNWEQSPADGKEDRLELIGSLLKDAEAVIHAGDPDDEGQLLVDEVLRWFAYTGPVERLDTANTTKAALARALANTSDNKPREADGWAAYARSVADLMVGVNMSRFFTCSNRGKTLTVGRVQTPTLGLVVNRDLLIESHEKLRFYTIGCKLQIGDRVIDCTVQLPKEDARLTDGKLLNRTTAEKIAKNLEGTTLDTITITKKKETEQPPLPFNLVKLQTYCGNNWSYDPQQVMNITQRLKDSGAITYNRSDCQYLSSDHFREAPRTTATVMKNLNCAPVGLDTGIRSAAFNDKLITAHFAIIPTDSKRDLGSFTPEERNVYEIIAKYYLAQFMPPCLKEKTSLLSATPYSVQLTATASVTLEEGFHRLLPAKPDPASPLSGFAEGTYSGTILSATVSEKETKPPARYTKTSLNEDMTRIAKYVENPEVKKLLLQKDRDKKGENGSIGTSATRATIIDSLIMRGFLVEKSKKLISTEMGREFYRILPDEIKKPDMTAYWWVIQEQIKSGEVPASSLPDSVLETIRTILTQEYPKMMTAAKIPEDKVIVGRCPRCGGYVVEGTRGFGCMNYKNGCKFTLWKTSNSPLLKHVTITPKMAESLLAGDTVVSKKLYSPKQDSCFYGGLTLDDQGGTYGADLKYVPAKRPPIGVCPRCGGDIVEGKVGFGCSDYQNGCRFTIWKKPKGTVFKNITIGEASAKKLLSGETITSKRLYSEKKDTEFFGGFRIADKGSDYGADLELVMDVERPVLGSCPRCGGNIIEGKNGFGCANYREGCRFIIWKKQKGSLFKNITINESTAKKLLAGETISSKHLYSEKKNTEFFGGFRLNDTGGDYGADFSLVTDLQRPVLGTCPRCGGDVVEGTRGYGCMNYKDGCRFTIWKKAKSGYLKELSLSEANAKALLRGEPIESTRIFIPGADELQSGTIKLEDKGSEFGADLTVTLQPGKKVGDCPRCGMPVLETPLGYRCSAADGACSFRFYKHPKQGLLSRMTFTPEIASKLLSGDSYESDLLYSPKKDKTFKGKIKLSDKGSEYGADFELLPFENTAPQADSSVVWAGVDEFVEYSDADAPPIADTHAPDDLYDLHTIDTEP